MSDFEKALMDAYKKHCKNDPQNISPLLNYTEGARWAREWFLKNYGCASFNIECKELRTENQRLREALEKIVNLDRFTKTDSSAYRMQVLAKEALKAYSNEKGEE